MNLVQLPSLIVGIKRYNDDYGFQLVYNLGGGYLDVSMLKVQDGYSEVIACACRTKLCGGDFDTRLVNYFV